MTWNTLSRGTSRIRTFLLALVLMAPTWTLSHAQLPPEVEADRLLLVARDALEAKQWGKARQALDDIMKLGIPVPSEFHYHRARALANDNSPREAREALTVFLKSADRSSTTYRDALALFNKVDAEINREESARKAAAEAAATRELAERQAYAAMSESEKEAVRKAKVAAEKKKRTLAAAEAGDVAAQFEVGTWYYHGRNGERQDYRKARQWYLRAADKNHAEAQHMLAVIYGTGRGVQKNTQLRHEYRVKAARNGHAESQGILGKLLILDTLTMRDGPQKTKVLQEANKWLSLSAQGGDSDSQHFVAQGLYDGNPKSKNSQEARRLWRLAASKGHKLAADALAKHFGER